MTTFVSLGTASDSFLLSRLDDEQYEKYSHGIVSYLRWKSNAEPREKKIIFDGLVKFVNKIIQRDAKISQGLENSVGDALVAAIGQRGGEAGVSYLADWVTTDKFVKRVQCRTAAENREKVADLLRRDAVIGLGFSGSKKALDILNGLAQNPPQTMYPGSFRGVLNRAISENTSIQKDGEEKFFH